MNVVQDSACNCELTKTPLCEPSGHAMEKKAAENYVIKFETTQGDFEVEVRRAWAPNGADRVFNLVRLGFFTNTAFYRTIHRPACNKDWVVQFGVSSDPRVSCIYNANDGSVPAPGAIIPDDPVYPGLSNTAGVLSFSAVLDQERGGFACNRTTELYISYKNNSMLDKFGFALVGKVMKDGMQVVRKLYAGYGEMEDACDLHGYTPCKGPLTSKLYAEGLSYLKQDFPKLDYIKQATILKSVRPGGDDNLLLMIVVLGVAFTILGVLRWIHSGDRLNICCPRVEQRPDEAAEYNEISVALVESQHKANGPGDNI